INEIYTLSLHDALPILKDISIPYMDLVFHPDTIVKADTKTSLNTEGIKNDTLTVSKTEISTSKEPENKIPIWLIISIIINLVLRSEEHTSELQSRFDLV